jgi:tetratricopeptide (TPR) repeat protein
MALLKNDRVEQAKVVYLKLLGRSGTDRTFRTVCSHFMATGRHEEMIAFFTTLSGRFQDREILPLCCALACINSGRRGEAEQYLRQSIKKNPNPDAYRLLCELSLNEHDYAAAQVYARRLLALDSSNPAYFYLLAQVLEKQGNYREAADALRQAIRLAQDASTYHSELLEVEKKLLLKRDSQ